jgi:PhnB protein
LAKIGGIQQEVVVSAFDALTVPEGQHTITPHIVVRGAAEAAVWYERALGALEAGHRIEAPDGRLIHLELRFGDSSVMVADEFPEMDVRSPLSVGGTSIVLQILAGDVDSLWRRAVDAGATILHPIQDQFWGERQGQIGDPFGHRWNIARHERDVPPEEVQAAANRAFGGATPG